MRPTFLLLQTAFCLGLAGRAADEADAALAGSITEVVFAERRAEVRERLRALRGDYHALLSRASSGATRPIAPERLLRLRLDAARLVREATGLEAAAVGGRGYLAASGTARRLREAAFLPVQSPTEGHLEWELRRLRG
ncbi:MAG: hypothetical protein GXX90_05495 [Microbacteriaceae bacterium]|nr:hypothetical protein [Microbacteriaceae bacterium]